MTPVGAADVLAGGVGWLVTVVSPLVVAGALVVAGSVLARTRSTTMALGILLDLFLVVGLLRLSTTATWAAIVTAAAIVLIRKVVMLGLARGRQALAADAPQPTSR